jgi:exodeoxyribonuclease VII large subunit
VAGERLRSLAARRRLELAGGERALAALSPRRVLERGYSVTTRDGDSRPLTDASAINTGERIVTTFAVGQVRSLVLGRGKGSQGSLFEEDETVES